MPQTSLKIIFAGTPEFVIPTLDALSQSPHQLISILTQPDKPAGRGQKLSASPAKQWALQHQIPVMQPASLRDEAIQQTLRDLQPDVMIVAAYGLLLPEAVLSIPRFGCINIHPSILPRWRGASPIQSAILNGDTQTGVTIMQMEKGMDSGPMLHKVFTLIESKDTAKTLHDRLAILSANALIDTLKNIDHLKPEPQNAEQVTFAHKILKDHGHINWHQAATVIDCAIRAFNPWPIAYAHTNNTVIRIFQASILDEKSSSTPGTILRAGKDGIDVTSTTHVLRLEQLQCPGGKVLSARELLHSKQSLFQPGALLS
jgi:methionyl-tRNA formyltransferase